MTQDDLGSPGTRREELDEKAAMIHRLVDANEHLSQMYKKELELGQRTVAGLIFEVQKRLVGVAHLQKPGAPPLPSHMTAAEKLTHAVEHRQLNEEGYMELLDLVFLLGEALDLIGAPKGDVTNPAN